MFVRDDDPESAEALIADLDPGSTRLEGLILRSQLLVLLQRKHFCDSHGKPIGRDPNPRWVAQDPRVMTGPLIPDVDATAFHRLDSGDGRKCNTTAAAIYRAATSRLIESALIKQKLVA